MKTFLLLLTGMLMLVTGKAQFSQNFEGSESDMTGNCWTLLNVYKTTATADVITGTGSMYTNPPTSGSGTRDIISPALNITSTILTVSFKYKVSSQLNGNATRTIETGLVDVNGNFTSLHLISINRNSPTTVQTFNQTFTLGSVGIRKLVLRLGGATGDGNSRLIFDDISVNAAPLYGAGTCNSAPVAVNDVFSGPMGSILTGNLLTNDSDPNNEAIRPSVVLPSSDGTLLLNQDGSFSFTPNPAFAGSSTTFTYNLVDAGFDPLVSNTASVTLNFISGVILPVELLNFDARYDSPNVSLTWSTAMEKNFSHFVIECAVDENNFKQIAVVYGAGESDRKNDYSYFDKNMAGKGGLIYYRLKCVDTDGKSTYSAVRVVRLGDQRQGTNLATYPNPVRNELNVTVPSEWQGKVVVFEIYNQSGQKLKISTTGNANHLESLGLNELAKGFYVIKASCGSETAHQKIIKN